MCKLFYAAILAVCVASAACAAIVVPGAEGYDGPFNPTGTSYVVDLAQAVTGSWDDPPEVPGNGVYDPEKWAVVFKYESVNIPAGCTVTFKNHPSRAPVVWLVSGDVTIAGSVNLNGTRGVDSGLFTEAGPGGFRGGAGHATGLGSSPGLGPGGGNSNRGASNGRSSGSYSTVGADYNGTPGEVYGSALCLPLIGGSGGTGLRDESSGGGGGGGAIVIAAAGAVTIAGSVQARGERGWAWGQDGSGGAIRLVADTITGAGNLLATAVDGAGGLGRIRVEANTKQLSGVVSPAATINSAPITTAQIWPPQSYPSLKVVSLGGQPVGDPKAGLVVGSTDTAFGAAGNQRIIVEARNVPADWVVRARAASRNAAAQFVTLTQTGGDETSSTWEGDVNLPQGITAIQVRAAKP